MNWRDHSLPWMISIIVILLVAAAVIGRTGAAPAMVAGVPVGQLQASPQPTAAVAERLIGVLVPNAQSDVASKLDATVRSIHVGVGGQVTTGQLLITLANTSIDTVGMRMAESELRMAEAELERANLDLQRVRGQLSRARDLAAQQLISQQQLEDAAYQERMTASQVAVRESALTSKRILHGERRATIAELEVRAPLSGEVAFLFVNPGSPVRSADVILRIVKLLPMKLRFAIPPERGRSLRTGQLVTATLDGTSEPIRATVQWVTPEVDSLSQLLLAEAAIDDASTANLGGAAAVRSLVGRKVSVEAYEP